MTKKKNPVPPPRKQQPEIKKTSPVTPAARPTVTAASTSYRAKAAEAKSVTFVFGKINYIIMVGGLVLIALGFILMIGGGSKDPKVFNPEIFNTQRLTVAPLLILLGFVAQVVAILKKNKE
jgi:hypothetical protein